MVYSLRSMDLPLGLPGNLLALPLPLLLLLLLLLALALELSSPPLKTKRVGS